MTIIPRNILIAELSEIDLFPDWNRIKDSQYVVFDHNWLVNDFLPWWRYHKKSTGLVYVPEKNDCDDFAERFKVKLKEALRQNSGAPQAAAPVAQMGIQVPPAFTHHLWIAGRHELNLVRTTSGWHVVEPQNERIAPVTSYPFREFIKHDEIEF